MKKVNQIVEIYDILVPHLGADYKAAEILDLAIGSWTWQTNRLILKRLEHQ